MPYSRMPNETYVYTGSFLEFSKKKFHSMFSGSDSSLSWGCVLSISMRFLRDKLV